MDAIIIMLVLPFGRPVSRLLAALGVPISTIDTNAGAIGAIFLFLAVGTISFMGTFLIFGPKKQTLYDRLKKTAVFKG